MHQDQNDAMDDLKKRTALHEKDTKNADTRLSLVSGARRCGAGSHRSDLLGKQLNFSLDQKPVVRGGEWGVTWVCINRGMMALGSQALDVLAHLNSGSLPPPPQ